METNTQPIKDLLEVDNWYHHHDYSEAFKDVFEEMQGAMSRIRIKAPHSDQKIITSLKESNDQAQVLYNELRTSKKVLSSKEEADQLLQMATTLYNNMKSYLDKL